jgi:DNA invertase Pin-like site-specific DNA recombinase
LLGKYKGRVYSADKAIRNDYVKMMNSGEYPVSYISKMAQVSRQTLYNWKKELELELE